MNERPRRKETIFLGDLLCYWELVRTGVTGPFVVSGLSRNHKEVRAIGTEQHLLHSTDR
jgi:hypothetical protein